MIVFEEYCLCECCALERPIVRSGRRVLCRTYGSVLNGEVWYD
jgi:hypothetical protein